MLMLENINIIFDYIRGPQDCNDEEALQATVEFFLLLNLKLEHFTDFLRKLSSLLEKLIANHKWSETLVFLMKLEM